MPDRRLLAACVSAASAGIVLSVFFHSGWTTAKIYSDIESFWGRNWVSQGLLPYTSSSTFFEYPPISGMILYASRAIGSGIAGVAGGQYAGYYIGFSALSLLAAAATSWSTWRLANGLGVQVNPAYFFLPSMVVYGIYNFDLFDALFIVLSLQLFVEKRRGWSSFFLGLALGTKLIGVVLLPVFLLELTDWKERARYAGIALVTGGAFFVPVWLVNPGFFGQFLSYFSNWPVEDAWYVWVFGNPYSYPAKVFGLLLLAFLLLIIYSRRMPLLQRSFLALSAYLLSTYIYAPQFNLTLIPLVAVLALTSPWLFFWEAFNALIILTWFAFPNNQISPWTVPQTMALIRSASLALLSLSVASGTGHSFLRWLNGLGASTSRKTVQVEHVEITNSESAGAREARTQ